MSLTKTLVQSRLLDMIAEQHIGSELDYQFSRGALNFAIRLGFVSTKDDPFYPRAVEAIEARYGLVHSLRGKDAAATTLPGMDAMPEQ